MKVDNKRMGNKLIKNTMILFFGTFCTKGIMFFMVPLFTRWLTQTEYGKYDVLSTYITLLLPIITLNIGEATFRFLVEEKKKNKVVSDKKIVSSSLITTLLGLLITIILLLIFSILNNSINDYILSFIVLLICQTINSFFLFVIRGFKKLHIYTISNILYTISTSTCAFVLLYIYKMGLNGILLSYSFGYLISTLFIMINIKINKYFSYKMIDLKLTKDMLKFSSRLIPSGISWWVIEASDRTIVSTVLGSSVNAIYAISNKIPNLCYTFYNVFNISWLENAVEVVNDKNKDKYYTYIMNKMTTILISLNIGILSINYFIYKLLFKAEYFSGYYQVPILTIAIILNMLVHFIGAIYISRMEPRKNGITASIGAILNIIINLSLIRFIGLYAATISTVLSYLILFLIRYIDIKKSINIKFEKKTIIMSLLFIYFIITSYIINIVLLIINIILAIIIFIIANKDIINEILSKIKSKICNKKDS